MQHSPVSPKLLFCAKVNVKSVSFEAAGHGLKLQITGTSTGGLSGYQLL